MIKSFIQNTEILPLIEIDSLQRNGPEWWRLRSALQKNLSKPVYIRQFIDSTNAILNDLVQAIDGVTQPMDIERYLANLNLEREWIYFCLPSLSGFNDNL